MANDDRFTDSTGKSLTPDEKRAALRRVQADMAIYQSDVKGIERDLQAIDLAVRDLERKFRALDIEIKTRKQEKTKKERDLFEVNEQLRLLKKKINLLM